MQKGQNGEGILSDECNNEQENMKWCNQYL